MIEISDLIISYGNKIILENINLTMQKGQVHVFLGKNGSGKTSFFNSVYRFIKNYGGTQKGNISYNKLPLKRSDISYLMSDQFYYNKITGYEHLEIICGKDSKYLIDTLNSYFTLPLNEYIHTYSKGMKKKVSLISTFSVEAPIYILDEPFSDLDILGIDVTLSYLKKLKRDNKIILLSTHMLREAEDILDKIYLIKNKSVTYFDNIDELKSTYNNEQIEF